MEPVSPALPPPSGDPWRGEVVPVSPPAPAYVYVPQAPPLPFPAPPYRSPGVAFLWALLAGPFGLYYLGTRVGNPWAAWSVVACLLTCGAAAPVAWVAAMVAAPALASSRNARWGLVPR